MKLNWILGQSLSRYIEYLAQNHVPHLQMKYSWICKIWLYRLFLLNAMWQEDKLFLVLHLIAKQQNRKSIHTFICNIRILSRLILQHIFSFEQSTAYYIHYPRNDSFAMVRFSIISFIWIEFVHSCYGLSNKKGQQHTGAFREVG